MSEIILLKKSPKIEIHLLENGFQITDEQTERNSGFYPYNDLKSVELNKTWFPRLAKWLKVITWIFNGVPLFADGESFKKANVIIHFKKSKVGMWLTDTYMVKKAKLLKGILDQKTAA